MKPDQPIHLAIIEDNEVMAEMIRDYLGDKFSGAEISLFKTGDEALQGIHSAPDVILLDYNLDTRDAKALNGIQVMMQLKEKFSSPVIFLTAQERPEIAASIIKHGAADYVVKNQQSFGKLERSIRQILETGKKGEKKPRNNWLIALLIAAFLCLLVYLML